MIICIDEASQFNLEKDYKQDKTYPCVVAVVFPNVSLEKWNESYSLLSKGSSIKKSEANEIIEFLAKNKVKAFLSATNFVSTPKNVIEKYRDDYLSSAISSCKNNPDFARLSVHHHCKILKNLSLPDYVKAMLFIQLIENIIRSFLSNTEAFKRGDLNSFQWYSDVMSKKIYPTVCHFVHYSINRNSYRKPIKVDNESNILNFLNIEDANKFLDTTKLISSVEFQSDDKFPGIKAADCMANFFQRILRGSLKIEKPESLMNLFDMPHSIDLLIFDKDRPYIDVKVSENGKKVLENLMKHPSSFGKINKRIF